MKRMILSCLAALAMPAAAWAQVAGPAVNGLTSNPRVFNDLPSSTLVIVNGNSVNMGALSSASISDTFVGGGTGVNRHDILLSADAGATAATFGIDDSYTFKTLVNLDPLNDSPRKEAGIRLNAPGFGDALFIINSDAGEIVAFGGPFYGEFDDVNGYTSGQTILMGITVVGGGDGIGGSPTTIEYFIDRDGPGAAGFGIESSGPLPFTNLEGGLPSYTAGVYGQGGPGNNTADQNLVLFSDIMYTTIPEPSTVALGLAALIGLVAVRRR